jgi:hypothetical protein
MIHLDHLQKNGKPVLHIDKTDWLALTSDITDHFVHLILSNVQATVTVETPEGDIIYTDEAQEIFNHQLDNVERTLLDWVEVQFTDEEAAQ